MPSHQTRVHIRSFDYSGLQGRCVDSGMYLTACLLSSSSPPCSKDSSRNGRPMIARRTASAWLSPTHGCISESGMTIRRFIRKSVSATLTGRYETRHGSEDGVSSRMDSKRLRAILTPAAHPARPASILMGYCASPDCNARRNGRHPPGGSQSALPLSSDPRQRLSQPRQFRPDNFSRESRHSYQV